MALPDHSQPAQNPPVQRSISIVVAVCLCSVGLAVPASTQEALPCAGQTPQAQADPAPLPWIDGSTTLAVLPDTEIYSKKHPESFEAQTRWIAENARAQNIAYVLHLGDIVHDDVEAQWQVAKRSFQLLDGKVPYALVPGNHDYTDAQRTTRINDFFKVADFQNWPTFGGTCTEDRIENSYHLCRIGNRDWIILSLEFGPRDEVVSWANQILDKHPDRLGILVTHAYLFRDNVRFDHTAGKKQRASPDGWGNDGEQLWQKLVRTHAGMRLVFSGHVATGGLGHLVSTGDHGNAVHQIMVDYENMRGGGSGYLRLVEFLPDGNAVQVRSYSPVLNRYLTDAGNQFTFTLSSAGLPDEASGRAPARPAK
jgi:predicted phosphodiesterase